MMRRTLGAPLGGTTRGGHQGVESFALSLMTPPNPGGGAGSCLPSTVVVALGEPNWPVTFWAEADVRAKVVAPRNNAVSKKSEIRFDGDVMCALLVVVGQCRRLRLILSRFFQGPSPKQDMRCCVPAQPRKKFK